MTKSELRKTYLQLQKNLDPLESLHKSEQITGKLFRHFTFFKIEVFHCFVPIEKFNEIDTLLIFNQLWKNFPHIQTFVPRVNFEEGSIENLKFTVETKLTKNIWQIYEPSTGETIETTRIDMILVPLLCFDKKGFRVGYGKGFYDKLLKKCRKDCLKIGLSYFEPVKEISDVKNFDVKLDFCITPEKIWKLQTQKIGKEIIKL